MPNRKFNRSLLVWALLGLFGSFPSLLADGMKHWGVETLVLLESWGDVGDCKQREGVKSGPSFLMIKLKLYFWYEKLVEKSLLICFCHESLLKKKERRM